MNELVRRVEDSKIIAIVRGIAQEKMGPLFNAFVNGGIEFAEVTMNTEGALESIEKMNQLFGSQIVIGAGTVLDKEMAEKAVAAGARFLVSPNLDAEVIKTALDNDVLPIPGVMTPTEIAQALKYGAPIVKLFPASSLGAGYVKELKGPFSNLKLIAVGGICKENIKDFIKSGAIGVGIGGSLVDKNAIERGDYTRIADYAKQLRASMD